MLRSLITFKPQVFKTLVGLVFLAVLWFSGLPLATAANSHLINQQPLEESQVLKHIENAFKQLDQQDEEQIINQLLEDQQAVQQLEYENLPKPKISLEALPQIDALTEEKIQQDLARLLKDIDKPGNEADLSQAVATEIHNGPLVLVSFSMPDELIKSLGKEVAKAKGSLVLRGLIDNDFKATFARLTELAEGQGLPIMLDPVIFARFESQQVPTFVVAHNLDKCQADQPCKELEFSKLTGAVTLDYALNTIKNSSKYPAIQNLATSFLTTYAEANANE